MKLVHVDPRTKLFLLLMGNLAVFFSPALWYEILLAGIILLFGILCGVYRFSMKMAAFYLAVLALQLLGSVYLHVTLAVVIVSFVLFVRKIFPCAMLGGILVSTTRVNEFMAAMNRIHTPKSVVIPLTVMLRYFPMVGEDWRHIKDAMRMRGVSPTFAGLITQPNRTVECIYVPLMMSASKIADELSAAAVTRGIENPKMRTCLQQIRFRPADLVCALSFTVLFGLSFLL
ncbi:MAG: energy-coupling factor transporter transmembrane component T [Clostridiaceae bacterium]|nr:energy-coupling factor transporter transmembrane component T [Clostridiaceae bacterium]